MSCDSNKISISKGSENTLVFRIKQDNSTLPLDIVGTDSFYASLILLEDSSSYPQVTDKVMDVVDALNGEISLTIPKEDTLNLVSERGHKVDRYYQKPTYKLILECNTENNGNFIAKVSEVYVD